MGVRTKRPPFFVAGTTPRTLSLDDLSRLSLIITVALCLLVQCGCGLSLNPNAQAATNQAPSTPSTGGPGGQAVPVPGSFQALTGCTNPNTGASNGDWGVGSNPVYTWISNTSPVVGMPIYTSNTVFWTSRETPPASRYY
jgi:hypothetical protein